MGAKSRGHKMQPEGRLHPWGWFLWLLRGDNEPDHHVKASGGAGEAP